MDRDKKIIRTSVLGILVNVLLVIFKAFVGFLANSVAVILDAVNNLSDALSSVITIIGTKLSGKKPDKKHPYGHGRVEYLTSVIIAVIVLIAGLTALYESILKIFTPQETEFQVYSLIIIAVAVLVKFFFGRYVKGVGKKLNSQTLIASGSDALFDSILSFATLVSGLLVFFFDFNVEGYLGAAISIFIVKSGIEILIETLNSIIGTRADKELTDSLKESINAFPEVHGAYDLTLHNYGPNKIIGSVHVEVDDDMTAKQIHKLSRVISAEIYMKYGIVLTVGVYAKSEEEGEAKDIKTALDNLAASMPEILQIHGFYVDEESKTVTFDIVVDFKADAESVRNQVIASLSEKFPNYFFAVVLDSDFSD